MPNDPQFAAAMNWECCVFTKVRGRSAIVLTVRTSTSAALGILPITAQMLERSRVVLDFDPLSRSGRILSKKAQGTVILTSAGLIFRTQAGRRVATFTNIAWPAHEIVEEVDLYILVAPPDRLRLQASIHEAASRRLVVGAKVDVLDLRVDEIRPDVLGIFASAEGERLIWPPPECSVILDQNFLVELDRCLNQRNATNWPHIREMLAWLSGCDTIPGFALAECRYGKDGAVKVARLRSALEAFEYFEGVAVDRHVVAAKYHELASTYSKRELPSKSSRDVIIGLNYLGVLRAAVLWESLRSRPWKGEQRVKAWNSWIDSLNQPDIGIPAYCLATVRNLLLGDEPAIRMAEKQLKIVRRVNRKDLLGAAWDLTYLTIADMARAGILEETGGAPVVFLTADKPLLAAASSANLVDTQALMGVHLGVVAIHGDISVKFNSAARARIAALDSEVRRGQSMRAAAPRIDFGLIDGMIDELERELEALHAASWRG